MTHKSMLELWLKTEKQFGTNNASFLFGEYIPLSIPKKQYHTVTGIYKHMKRETNGFYKLRQEIRKAKQFQQKYGTLGEIKKWNSNK